MFLAGSKMPPPAWLPWHIPTVPIKAAISLQCAAWSFQIPYVPVTAKAFGASMTQVGADTCGLHTRRFSAEAHTSWPGAGDRPDNPSDVKKKKSFQCLRNKIY